MLSCAYTHCTHSTHTFNTLGKMSRMRVCGAPWIIFFVFFILLSCPVSNAWQACTRLPWWQRRQQRSRFIKLDTSYRVVKHRVWGVYVCVCACAPNHIQSPLQHSREINEIFPPNSLFPFVRFAFLMVACLYIYKHMNACAVACF